MISILLTELPKLHFHRFIFSESLLRLQAHLQFGNEDAPNVLRPFESFEDSSTHQKQTFSSALLMEPRTAESHLACTVLHVAASREKAKRFVQYERRSSSFRVFLFIIICFKIKFQQFFQNAV